MTSYQGPHASVTQQFVTSPGAVAVENVPPVIIATAFDVYKEETLGSHIGIEDEHEVAWEVNDVTIDKVVYESDYIGERGYNYYPVVTYAETDFGNTELTVTAANVKSTGIDIQRDQDYAIPSVVQAAGESTAIIPYYDKTTAVVITVTEPTKITITDGSVVTSQIKAGQKVFVYDSAWYQVGVVASAPVAENIITLATSYAAGITGTRIVIGADSTTLTDYPCNLYDSSVDFVNLGVQVGDLLYYSSRSIAASLITAETASITSVTKHMLKFNTTNLNASTTGNIDSNFVQYQYSLITPGGTIGAYYYDIKRLVGFSQNLDCKAAAAGAGVAVTRLGADSFTIPVGSPVMQVGDAFCITPVASGNPPVTVNEERDMANLRIYRVVTRTDASGVQTITTDQTIYQSVTSAETDFISTDFLTAWRPIIESNILADFRAIRSEENGVVKRITSLQDIETNWAIANSEYAFDPRNELAFMASIAFIKSGQNVLYGVNVDASASNLSTEYANALDELEIINGYSHAFGTTNASVNALMSTYVNAESEPYQAHEKIGVIAYDEEDVYLMGTDTGSNSAAGLITISGGIDLVALGVTVNDTVKIYTAAGAFVEEVTVTETAATTVTVQTDCDTLYASHTYKFMSGRKEDRANRIAALSLGERRVSIVWPGWFTATYGDETTVFPPYFITAAIAGMDSSYIASQSFTNMPFTIPGLSSIVLGTNTYFKKLQLDTIGAGGIDIMIQDASTTNSIKSRHDLTTNMDSVQYRERSITKQADVCAKTIRASVSPYVGRYNITKQLFTFLGQVCSIASGRLIKDGVIKKLTIDSIKRDEVIDDKINFYLTATAYIAGNYYDITLTVTTR